MDLTTPARRPIPRAQSPTLERMEEKRELNELNLRLESYIQHVNNLSALNDDLRRRLDEARQHPGTQFQHKVYDEEISTLRLEITKVKNENAMAERDLKKLKEELGKIVRENDDLARALKKVEDDKIGLTERLPELERQVELLNRLLQEERESSGKRLREKEAEIDDLKSGGKLLIAKQLEEERESWKKAFDKEREGILATHSRSMRLLQESKGELEVENSNLKVNNASLTAEVQALQAKHAELLKENKTLQLQVEKLVSDRDLDRLRNENASKVKAEEISRLRAELSSMKLEFTELTNAKFALDAEIAAYRRLLSVGEDRLGLVGHNGRPQITYNPPAEASTSRKRPHEEEIFSPLKIRKTVESEVGPAESYPFRFVNSKKGIVNIEELNPEGQYIRIANMTSSDINLGNWWLQIGMNGIGTKVVQPKRFKFPGDTILSAEDSMRVLVKITDGNEEEKGEKDEGISFSSSLIQVGTFIQLFDDTDNLISQVDLKQGTIGAGDEGAFDRVCAMM